MVGGTIMMRRGGMIFGRAAAQSQLGSSAAAAQGSLPLRVRRFHSSLGLGRKKPLGLHTRAVEGSSTSLAHHPAISLVSSCPRHRLLAMTGSELRLGLRKYSSGHNVGGGSASKSSGSRAAEGARAHTQSAREHFAACFKESPCFPVQASNISILHQPADFVQHLKVGYEARRRAVTLGQTA